MESRRDTNRPSIESSAGMSSASRVIARSAVAFLDYPHHFLSLGLITVVSYELLTVLLWTVLSAWMPAWYRLEIVEFVSRLGWYSAIEDIADLAKFPISLFLLAMISSTAYSTLFIAHQVTVGVEHKLLSVLRKSWRSQRRTRGRVFRNTYFILTAGVNLLFLFSVLTLFRYVSNPEIAFAASVALFVAAVLIAPYLVVAVAAAVTERVGVIGSILSALRVASGNRLRLTWFAIFSSIVIFILPWVTRMLGGGIGSGLPITLGETAACVFDYVVSLLVASVQVSLSLIMWMTAYLELRGIETPRTA